jgi:hypothetical protein
VSGFQSDLDERVLENRAASSLCELSEHICVELSTQRASEQQDMRQKIECSPWRLRKEETKLNSILHNIRKRSTAKEEHSKASKTTSKCSMSEAK